MPYLRMPDLGAPSGELLTWRCIRTGDGLVGNPPFILAPFSRVRESVEDSWGTTAYGTRLVMSRASGKPAEHANLYSFETIWEQYFFENDFEGYGKFQWEKRKNYPDETAWYPQQLGVGLLQSRTFSTLGRISDEYLPHQLKSKNIGHAGRQNWPYECKFYPLRRACRISYNGLLTASLDLSVDFHSSL